MKKLSSLIILLSILSLNCGYTTSSLLPGRIKAIHIENFENKVDYTKSGRNRQLYFPLMEVDIRNAIVDRYQFDGNLRIAKDYEADIILKGELVNYDKIALRFADNDDIEEQRIHVTVNLVLWDVENDAPMWTENGFTGESTFFIEGQLSKPEDVAVQEAIEDLARRVVERTIENW